MATKTFNARIANKRDTSANWTSNNPVLLNGEIIIVDTEAGQVRYKVGNGTSTYTQLPFTDESLITNINGKLSLSGGTMTGNIDMGGHKLTGLGAPVNPNDAVRQADLKVVSDEVDGIISGTTGITLAPATTTKIGGVIVGDGIEVEADGTISTNPVPAGGVEGQMLYKSADGAAWGDKPIMWVKVTQSGNAADKTLSEIYQAYQNGYMVYCYIVNWGVLPLSSIDSNQAVFFSTYNVGSDQDNIVGINADVVVIKDSGVSVTKGFDLSSIFLENPSGGTPGQVLTKTSTGEEWSDAPSGLPEGGTEGQMLYKSADGAEWGDKPNIYVNIKYSDGSYSADKTYEEIRQLLLDGFHVFALYGGLIFVLSSCLLESTISSIKFFNAKYESYRALSGSFFEIEPDSSVSNNSFDLDFSDYVPVTRSINGNRLSQDVHLSAEDVNAIENPANGTEGQILAKTSSGAAWVDAPESGLTQSEADERYLQLSGGTMTGALTLNGEPTEDLQAAPKQYVDALKPLARTITLTAAGWSSNSQTVAVSGVTADELDQLITPTPAIASQSAYYEAGIMCTGQAANSLTFTCQTVPTSNLTVYVVIQPLS